MSSQGSSEHRDSSEARNCALQGKPPLGLSTSELEPGLGITFNSEKVSSSVSVTNHTIPETHGKEKLTALKQNASLSYLEIYM